MKARHIARDVALMAIALTGSSASVAAQPQRGPGPNATKLMISACRTNDKSLALTCSDKLRDQISGDVSYRTLYVLSKQEVDGNLQASGYDPAVALAPSDAVTLAKNLRADEYMDITVWKTAAGYKVDAAVVLQRNQDLVQPLGSFEHAKIENIASQISRAYRDMHEKTFDKQKSCFALERERKYAEAQKEVDAGVKDYPKSTWLRYCQLTMMKSQKTPNPEQIAKAEELRAIDPGSKIALGALSQLYQAAGNNTKNVEILQELLKYDSTSVTLKSQIADLFASMGEFAKAEPIAQKGVADNPGDLAMVQLLWKIELALKKYKEAIRIGEEMVKLDSSLADTSYYNRMIGTAQADSNSAKASELTAKAAAKFPNVASYSTGQLNSLVRGGQLQQTVVVGRRILANNPKAPNVRVFIATAYNQMGQPDSALAVAKEMIAAGEDKEQTANIAVNVGNTLRVLPESLYRNDAPAKQAAWMKAYEELTWADTIAKGTKAAPQAKFLMGLAALSVGQGYLGLANEVGNKLRADIAAQKPDAAKQTAMINKASGEACPLVKQANEYFVIAQIALPAGGSFAPEVTRTLMGNLMQLNQSVETYNRGYHCK